MKSLEDSLAQYAAYHRDRRNVATHFAGIPMILFGGVLAAALVEFPAGAFPLTLAALLSIAACAYYLVLDVGFGFAMAATLFALCAAASEVAARLPPGGTGAIAAALFTAGWALQILGHRFEGRKPAFLDDFTQLLIGPVFLWAEVLFLLGARASLRRTLETRLEERDPGARRSADPA